MSAPAPMIFDPASLRAAVDKAFAAVPPGHGCASIEVTLPDGTVRAGVAARINEHWMVQAQGTWTVPTGDWAASIKVLASW